MVLYGGEQLFLFSLDDALSVQLQDRWRRLVRAQREIVRRALRRGFR